MALLTAAARCLCVLLIVAGTPFLGHSAAKERQAEMLVAQEYQIKAAFLYNFTQFIRWPEGASWRDGPEIVFGVLGQDPFGSALEQILNETVVDGKKLVVRRYADPAEIESCHVIFISSSETGRLESVLEMAGGAGVLTVGEMQGFAERGGIIQFLIERNKVRFQVNLDAAEKAGLKVGASVLSLAKSVKRYSKGARQ